MEKDQDTWIGMRNLCDVPVGNQPDQVKLHREGKKHRNREEESEKGVVVLNTIDPEDRNALKHQLENTFGKIIDFDFVPEGNKVFVLFDNPESSKEALEKVVVFKGETLTIKKMRQKPKKVKKSEILPKMNTTFDVQGSFDEQLEKFIKIVQPKDIQTDLNSLCSDLHKNLADFFHGQLQVIPFGSAVTGLYFWDSDVDCYIHIFPGYFQYLLQHRADVDSLHRELVTRTRIILYRKPKYFINIVSIPNASIPIVKFLHYPTRRNCDVSFKGGFGVHNSRLVHLLVNTDPRIRPLIMYLKYWAKAFGVSGYGKFSSYAVIMLILHHLQTCCPPVLPDVRSLQRNAEHDNYIGIWNCGFDIHAIENHRNENPSSVMELLMGFFRLYSEFDFSKFAICPYVGRAVPVEDLMRPDTFPPEYEHYASLVTSGEAKLISYKSMCVCIQDPFELSRNISITVVPDKFKSFQERCSHAARLIGDRLRDGNQENLLNDLLRRNENDIVQKQLSEKYLLVHLKDCPLAELNLDRNAFAERVLNRVGKIFSDVLRAKLETKKTSPNCKESRHKIEFKCVFDYDLWHDRRNAIKRYLDTKTFTTEIDREMAITKSLMKNMQNYMLSKRNILSMEVTAIVQDKDLKIIYKCDPDSKKVFRQKFDTSIKKIFYPEMFT